MKTVRIETPNGAVAVHDSAGQGPALALIHGNSSSSRAFSTALTIFSAWLSWSDERCSCFTASESRSKTLTEYQRTRLASQLPETMVAILPSASSTSGEKHRAPAGISPALPAATALLTSASRLVARSAETSTTGAPRRCESEVASMTSPRSLSRSHMLRPMTTGRPASKSCVVR